MLSRVVIRRSANTLRAAVKFSSRTKTVLAKNLPTYKNVWIVPITHVQSLLYSTASSPEEMIVDYNYVKKATSDSNVLIVDVREPDEIKEHGKIPSSINIPLGEVTGVLSTMSDKEFEKLYKKPKPSEDTQIIFYCMIGKRSGMAQQNALKLGYTNVKNYVGSWTDWAAKTRP